MRLADDKSLLIGFLFGILAGIFIGIVIGRGGLTSTPVVAQPQPKWIVTKDERGRLVMIQQEEPAALTEGTAGG